MLARSRTGLRQGINGETSKCELHGGCLPPTLPKRPCPRSHSDRHDLRCVLDRNHWWEISSNTSQQLCLNPGPQQQGLDFMSRRKGKKIQVRRLGSAGPLLVSAAAVAFFPTAPEAYLQHAHRQVPLVCIQAASPSPHCSGPPANHQEPDSPSPHNVCYR